MTLQLTVPLYRGQMKPGGIPRIDWTHPLAQGLVFYGFDTGTGVILDLVGCRKQVGPMEGGQAASLGVGAYGSGFLWDNYDTYYFAADAAIRNATANPPYSFACGYVQTGDTTNNNSRPFGRTGENGSNPPYLNWDFEIAYDGNQADINCNVNSDFGVGTLGYAIGLNTQNVYHTPVGIAWPDQGAFYFDGTLVGTASGLVVTSDDNPGDSIIFSGASDAGSLVPFVGFVYYGAFWSRALTPGEVALLHEQPYCFLTFPEDEFFVSGKGNQIYTQALSATASIRSGISVQAKLPRQLQMLGAPRLDLRRNYLRTASAGTSGLIVPVKASKFQTLSAAARTAGVLAGRAGKVIVGQAQVVNLFVAGQRQKAMSVTASTVPTLAPFSVGKLFPASAKAAPLVTKVLILSAHQTAATVAASLIQKKQHILAAAARSSSSLSRRLAHGLAATTSVGATLARFLAHTFSAAAGAYPSVGVVRYGLLAASVMASARLARAIAVLRTAAAQGSPGVLLKVFVKTWTSSAGTAAALEKSRAATMAAQASTAPALRTVPMKRLRGAAAALAQLGRLPTKIFSRSIGTAPTLAPSREYERTLTGSARALPSLQRGLARLVSAIAQALGLISTTQTFDPNRFIDLSEVGLAGPTIINEKWDAMIVDAFPPDTQPPFLAGTTVTFFGQLTDENGDPISFNALDTLTLTLIDTATGNIVNDCENQDILNNDRGKIDDLGNLTITLTVEDTALLNALDELEERGMLIEWTYNGSGKTGKRWRVFQLMAEP